LFSQVIIIDNLSNSFRNVFERLQMMVADYWAGLDQCHSCPSLEFHEADFRDAEKITDILRKYNTPTGLERTQCRSSITGVIHFAAFKSVEESIRYPLKYYANNVGGLIDFCATLGDFGIKKLVFSSSATVYGTVADKGIPLREEYCCQQPIIYVDEEGIERRAEAGSLGLTNPYGRTKWMCEAILSDLAKADPSWSITALRYFNPIGCDESGLLGEDPRGAASNLMPVILRVLTGVTPSLKVFGGDWVTIDGSAVRDYIHVTDLARGHLAALNSKSKSGFEVYNLGTGSGHTVLELVSAMEYVSQRSIPIQVVDRRDGDVGTCVARSRKAELELGWKAEKTLVESCRDSWRVIERIWKE
jgi:UDP-glucose 4-epimerase